MVIFIRVCWYLPPTHCFRFTTTTTHHPSQSNNIFNSLAFSRIDGIRSDQISTINYIILFVTIYLITTVTIRTTTFVWIYYIKSSM